MTLHQKIITARKKKGLTQEELAQLTNVTSRTIQRIESGQSIPRNHTLKAIAAALEIPYSEFSSQISTDRINPEENEIHHFLKMLCLSCFSYLVVPFVHFLIPIYILKNKKETNPIVLNVARKCIRIQIYWVILLHSCMLLTLAFNLLQDRYSSGPMVINYLWPFFICYALNAVLIIYTWFGIKRIRFTGHNVV